MEQRVIIWFFTLTGLKCRAIHIELVSVYQHDGLVWITVRKLHKCFQEGLEDPWHMILPKQFAIILSLIENLTTHPRRRTWKELLLSMDNTCPHNSRPSQQYVAVSLATRLLHLAVSPDPAPSDFFLFRCINEKLTGRSLWNARQSQNGDHSNFQSNWQNASRIRLRFTDKEVRLGVQTWREEVTAMNAAVCWWFAFWKQWRVIQWESPVLSRFERSWWSEGR
jgi:hypothetical protein